MGTPKTRSTDGDASKQPVSKTGLEAAAKANKKTETHKAADHGSPAGSTATNGKRNRARVRAQALARRPRVGIWLSFGGMTLMSRRVCRKQHTRISAGDMTTLKAMMMMIPAWPSCIRTGDMQTMRRPHAPTTNIVANT